MLQEMAANRDFIFYKGKAFLELLILGRVRFLKTPVLKIYRVQPFQFDGKKS